MIPTKKQFVVRLKSIEGHVRGVQRMVEADAYCVDLIQQAQAVRRALDKWNGLVLEAHLNGPVTATLRGEDPEARERAATDLLDVFQTTAGNQALPLPTSATSSQQRIAPLQQIEAQVRAVQTSVEGDALCVTLIQQSRSIQRNLDTFVRAVLADHLNGCVTQAIRGEHATDRERMVEELMQVFAATNAL
jgi:DNA-binding FrmR family transcriptional regulator